MKMQINAQGFNLKELELLLDGLDAIERMETASDAMGDLLSVNLARNKEQAEKLLEHMEERRQLRFAKVRERRMRIHMLKGKLAELFLQAVEEAPFDEVSKLD
jgi:hypothetical protein